MKRCFSLLLAAGVLAAPAMAQNLTPSQRAAERVPANATWAVPSLPAPTVSFGASTFHGQLNFVGGTSPDGPGTIAMVAPDYPTTSIEAEPLNVTPLAGWVKPNDPTTQYFINSGTNDDGEVGGVYEYVEGSGSYTLLGTVSGFNFPGQEGVVGAQVQPETGAIKVFTIGCEVDAATDEYFQSFVYDFDLETQTLSNGVELRDPAATGDTGDEGVCGISFSWDGADEIYGVDLLKDQIFSVDGTTGELIAFLPDPSDEGLIEDVNFIQTSAWDEATDTHYFFILSRFDPSNANIQGLVYFVDSDDNLQYGGYVDGNNPPNEVLSGSFEYNNVITAAEGGPEGASVAIGNAVPNPSATSARIPFSLEAAADVQMGVYDVLGRQVAEIATGLYGAGSHAAQLDASALAPGTYVVRLAAGPTVVTRTISIAR